jgi:Secretion system C-terminal sorting domain
MKNLSLLTNLNLRLVLLLSFTLNWGFSQTLVQRSKKPIYAVDQFIGANILRTANVPRLRSLGNIREYHDWVLDMGYPTQSGSAAYPSHKYKRQIARDGFDTKFDDLYAKYKSLNITINSALTGNCPQIVFPNMTNGQYGTWGLEKIPLNYNNAGITSSSTIETSVPTNVSSGTTPSAYANYADWLSSAAARYGNNQTLSTTQKTWLDTHNESSDLGFFGLNRLSYLEVWNEQNKNWRGTNTNQFNYTRFTPEQYAAMLSAVYDGHNGTVLAPDNSAIQLGVKKFDPNMKVAAGGVADIHKKYYDDMLSWFNTNRSTFTVKFPLDVVNLHVVNNSCTAARNGNPSSYYDTGASITGLTLGCNASSQPVSPEKDEISNKLFGFFDATLANANTVGNINYNALYRQLATAGKEFWISEYGYATDNSYQGTKLLLSSYASSTAPANIKAKYDKQEIQAQWLVRGILEMQAGGWDRSMIYWYQDGSSVPNDERDNPGIGAWDQNCGIIKNLQSNSQPKKAFYYTATFKNMLQGYKLVGEVTQGCTTNPSDVYASANVCPKVYQFQNGTQVAWVVWYPTSNAIEKTGVAVKLGNKRADLSTITATNLQVVNLEYPSEAGYTKSTTLTYNTGNVTMDVSERPTIVFTNLATAYQTNQVATTGLNIKANYENIIKLGWNIATVPDKYQIWYKKLTATESLNNTLPTFDIGISTDPTQNTGLAISGGANGGKVANMDSDYGFKLYSDEISGKEYNGATLQDRKSAIIGGLDPNSKYAFYVVPVKWVNKATPIAPPIYQATPSFQCQGILASTNSTVAKITLTTASTDAASSQLLDGQSSSFSQGVLYNNYVAGANGWVNSWGGSIINLGTPKKIDAIQYFRINGQVPIEFYYFTGTGVPTLTDPNWKKIDNIPYALTPNVPANVANCGGTFTVPSLAGCEEWQTMSNLNDATGLPIPSAQYIKMVTPTNGFQVKEVFFFTAPDNACTAPAAPTALTASLSPINVGQTSTLSATGCAGAYTFYNSGTGLAVTNPVSPAATTTYYATCTVNSCTSANSTSTVTVTVNNSCAVTFNSFTRIADVIANPTADPVNCKNYVFTMTANTTLAGGITIPITNLPGNGYSTFTGIGSLNFVTQTSFNWVLPSTTSGQSYSLSIKYCFGNPFTTATVSYSPCSLSLNTTNNARLSNDFAKESLEEKQVGDNSMKIYPNPSISGRFNLEFESSLENEARVSVVNQLGILQSEKVLSLKKGANQEILDVSNLPKGTYYVIIHSGDKIQKAIFLKE